jgi:carbon starvation protein
VSNFGFPVTVEHMDALARQVGEHTLFARTGGAATLAVGMAQIFSKVVGQHLIDLWYHFAIMFEALFILTTIDAGTRVARYILQDFLGGLWKPLGDTRHLGANLLASGLMVCGWGYFLIQGVRDPLGGINSLWPLFGIANQMLAAIALCLATTMILKMQLRRSQESGVRNRDGEAGCRISDAGGGVPHSALRTPRSLAGRPGLALVTLVPLVWLISVTFTAGVQKIWHDDPRIGFLAAAAVQSKNIEKAHAAVASLPDGPAFDRAAKEMMTAIQLYANNLIDAIVTGIFLALAGAVILLSVREWILLIARKKLAELHETPPRWLPDYAVAEAKPLHLFSFIALAFALAKELSGEADFERAQQLAARCGCAEHQIGPSAKARLFVAVTNERYRTLRRCC